MSITSIVNSVFNTIGIITGGFRNFLNSVTPDYSVLILIILAAAGSYYAVSKANQNKISAPIITGYWVYVLVGIIFFLILYKV